MNPKQNLRQLKAKAIHIKKLAQLLLFSQFGSQTEYLSVRHKIGTIPHF